MNNKSPPFQFGFALPSGATVGGVSSWSIRMSQHLNQRGWRASLLEHTPIPGQQLEDLHQQELNVVSCLGASCDDIQPENTKVYSKLLPAIYIPNYTDETYAVCAVLSGNHAQQMRVFGYCHTFLDANFELLCYYEAIIHVFVAVSKECADKLTELLPHRADDILVRPYGVDVPGHLERQYAPAGEPLRIVYAGRITTHQKRAFDLLELAQELVRSNVAFELRIIGEGPEKGSLISKYDGLDDAVKSRVRIEGGVPPEQLAYVLTNSDIAVLVSDTEGTSIFMLESLAYGCVPVVTKVSGTEGVIDYGKNGFVHPVGDLASMAKTIKRLDDDRALLIELGQAARASSLRYEFGAYVDWFQQTARQVWNECPPRVWPTGRSVLRNPSLRARVSLLFPWARPAWRMIRHNFGRRG